MSAGCDFRNDSTKVRMQRILSAHNRREDLSALAGHIPHKSGSRVVTAALQSQDNARVIQLRPRCMVRDAQVTPKAGVNNAVGVL